MAITLKETQTQTQTQTQTFDRKQLIERLKLGKKLLTAQIREQGCQLGLKSALSLSYTEFQRIEYLHRGHARICASSFADMWQWLASRQTDNSMEFVDGELSEMIPLNEENKTVFVEGWIEGVLSIWNQIKDELNDADLD